MVGQSQTLQMRQAQTLVMTPQMQQSLKILQLSSIELGEMLENEIQNNPLLEKDENSLSDEFDNTQEFEAGTEEKNSSDSFEEFNKSEISNDSEHLDAELNQDWSSVEETPKQKSDDYEDLRGPNIREAYDVSSIIEKTFSEEQNLNEFITDQINIEFNKPVKKLIAFNISGMLDNSGYLKTRELEKELLLIAEQNNVELKDIYEVIDRLKKFDPIGVFSENLQECLKIQLEEKNRLDPAISKFIDNLALVAKGEFSRLKRICKCDDEDIKEMLEEVKALNPRPSANFNTDNTQVKYPDLRLYKEHGEWQLEINNDYLPTLTINKDYYNNLKKAKKITDEQKEFLKDNYSSANFVIRAVNQRAKSILKVAAAIIAKQQEFFEKGINFLKPVTMKEIAELVELHESTVGRVVSNKYMETPIGVFELKFFFTQSLSSSDGGEDYSSETAKHQIKELIENESKVLSDDKISQMLKDKGIQVARRTVAKYREAMGLPTSAERKRLKKMNEL